MSDKSKATAFLLCYFLGFLGAHRFYVNRWKTGVLMLITLGGLGLWWLIDSILLAAGVLRDGAGQPLRTGPPNPYNRAAGFWVRVAAFTVDILILNLIVGVLFAGLGVILPLVGLGALGAMGGDLSSLEQADPATAMAASMTVMGVLFLITIVPQVLYFGIQHASRHQATIGKRCFDIYVTNSAGGRMGIGRGIWRALCYILSAIPLYLGFVMAAFTRDKRALHDLLAGTRVRYVAAAEEVDVASGTATDTSLPEPEFEPEFEPELEPDLEPAAVAVSGGAVRVRESSGVGMMIIGALLLAAGGAMAVM